MSATTIGIVLFPALTQLDVTDPLEVLSRRPKVRLLLVADTR